MVGEMYVTSPPSYLMGRRREDYAIWKRERKREKNNSEGGRGRERERERERERISMHAPSHRCRPLDALIQRQWCLRVIDWIHMKLIRQTSCQMIRWCFLTIHKIRQLRCSPRHVVWMSWMTQCFLFHCYFHTHDSSYHWWDIFTTKDFVLCTFDCCHGLLVREERREGKRLDTLKKKQTTNNKQQQNQRCFLESKKKKIIAK